MPFFVVDYNDMVVRQGSNRHYCQETGPNIELMNMCHCPGQTCHVVVFVVCCVELCFASRVVFRDFIFMNNY